MTSTAVAPGYIEPDRPAPRVPIPDPSAPKVEPPMRIEEPPIVEPAGSPTPTAIPNPVEL